MKPFRHGCLSALAALCLLAACGGGSSDTNAAGPILGTNQTQDKGGGADNNDSTTSSTKTPAALAQAKARYKGMRRLAVLQASPVSRSAAVEVPAILHFDQDKETLSFDLAEDVEGNGRLNLRVAGKTDAQGGWQSESPANGSPSSPTQHVSLRIDPDGKISGHVKDTQLNMDISGRLSDTKVFLRIQIDATPQAPAQLAGMRHVHLYDLPRDTGEAKTDEQTRPDGNCQNVRWKLKPRMNWQTGLIDTIRVPVCER